jgi:hypothetical protein
MYGRIIMTQRKPRIDKGVPKKGIHPIERKTIIRVKKRNRATKNIP